MRITNYHNFPQPLVDAVKGVTSTKVGDVSVTELISPRQQRFLSKKQSEDPKHELVTDVSERIWALLGSAVHQILEFGGTGPSKQEGDGVIREKLLTADVHGWKLSGHCDLFETGPRVVSDYKITSAWGVKDGPKDDWEKQLNCYAYLWRKSGYDPQKLQIVTILRDWSKLEAKRNRDYPQTMVKVFDIPMWSEEKAAKFVEDRIKAMQNDEILGMPPPCTDEEQWRKSNSWAVFVPKKNGAMPSKASKVFYQEFLARQHVAQNPGAHIKFRPGSATRCENYCEVRDICPQYAKEKRELL